MRRGTDDGSPSAWECEVKCLQCLGFGRPKAVWALTGDGVHSYALGVCVSFFPMFLFLFDWRVLFSEPS